MAALHPALSAEARGRIETAVAKLEKETSGELVPMLVPSVTGYVDVHYLAILLGIAVGGFAVGVYAFFSAFPVGISLVAMGPIIGGALGTVMSFIPSVKRAMIGSGRLSARTRERALAEFVAQGVLETKDRTGILLLVCKFEHRLEIVADQGIHAKAGESVWTGIAAKVGPSIREQGLEAGFLRAIELIGEVLKAHFPVGAGDRDELPNRVRDGESS